MTAPTLSLTESQTLTALGTFLTAIMPAGVAIVTGQDNRVAAPSASDYLTMTPIAPARLATNETTYADGYLLNPAAPSTRSDLMRETVTVQVDIHGPGAANNTAIVMAMFRSSYGADLFAGYGYDVAPLYTSNPRQLPFLNESNQIEKRYSIDLVLQCNPVLTVAQQFAGAAAVNLVNVETAYPPGKRALSVLGQQIVHTGTGTPVKWRGWNWSLYSSVYTGDGAAAVAQGATGVRIKVEWWGLWDTSNEDNRDDNSPQTGYINPVNLAILDAAMAEAAEAGLWINLFIESRCGQDGLQTEFGQPQPPYCDPYNEYPDGHNFWTDLSARQKFIETWQFLAARYASNPRFVILEPLVEPNPTNYTAADIRAFYAEVTAAVRPVCPGLIYLVGARKYEANSIGEALVPGATDIAYTADLFPNITGNLATDEAEWSSRLANCTAFATANNVPFFCQQVGVTNTDDPTYAMTAYMLAALNAAEVPWEWWTYKAIGSSGFGPVYSDGAGGWITNAPFLAAITAAFP